MNTSDSSITGEYLAMDTTSGADSALTFTSNTSDLTTTGFIMFGATLMWQDSDSETLESNFIAYPVTATDGSQVWQLKWDTNANDDDDFGIPVTLRNLAPSISTGTFNGNVTAVSSTSTTES